MAWLKKHWKLVVILVVIIGGAILWFATRPKDQVEIITDFVIRESLVQTVEATGDLESIEEVDLSFDISGTIREVFVEVGDQVGEEELLAVLKTEELEANLENARQALQAAQANLAQRRAGSTVQAIDDAAAVVSGAEVALSASRIELENVKDDLVNTKILTTSSVNEAKVALSTAQDALDNLFKSNIQTLESVEDDVVTTLKSNMIAVRSALSDADEVLGIDNSLGNDDFEDILSALDFQALISANNSYKRAAKSRDRGEDAAFALTINSETLEIELVVGEVEKALLDTEDTLLQTRRVLDATAVDTADFSFQDLSALKASVDAARVKIQSEHSALLSSLNLIISSRISTQSTEDDARNSLAQAEQSLESRKAEEDSRVALGEAAVRSAEVNVQIREADLLQAKARLAEVRVGPRFVDVAALEAEVRRSSANLDGAQARLERAEIKSTLAGVVTDIALEEGEQVFEGATVITVQTTENQFQIVVDVPEADIAKVELADRAELTFDAFGDDEIFSAMVSEIDPAENVLEGVVFYNVTMLLDEDVIPAMKPGMTADVTIVTDQKEDVLTVPQRSVLRKNGMNYVRIPTSGVDFEERIVEVGLRGDGGRVEILNGVSEGEEVIISIRD